MNKIAKKLTFLLISFLSNSLFAAGGLDYYQATLNQLGISSDFKPVLGALLSLFFIILLGMYFKKKVESSEITPAAKFSLQTLLEAVMGLLLSISKEQCGKVYKTYMPILSGLFVFILVSNLSGLVPGFPPPTEFFNTNLAMGVIVFLVYNYAGIKEHGPSYIKQFSGPFLVLAPLFLCLETISHCARPLSLAFRLTANIFCDHLLLGVFAEMAPLVVPALLLLFGLLVACIQSFVFAMLSGIYINMAISHDH